MESKAQGPWKTIQVQNWNENDLHNPSDSEFSCARTDIRITHSVFHFPKETKIRVEPLRETGWPEVTPMHEEKDEIYYLQGESVGKDGLSPIEKNNDFR
ncbi:hypothetical protein EAG_09877 [Camponotus floridanus]|uniref:Uncharacterized protein n=1 Tax=Camponotus floridanus TaxID=104421 RepID=E2A6A3_CAMFO|nr:hypothetical protein EAG_09877 [Camponotus floridanus]